MNRLVGVYGASGFGREVMPIVREQYSEAESEFVFIDDASEERYLNGHRVMTYEEYLESSSNEKSVSIAISDSEIRSNLTEKCLSDGVEILSVKAGNSLIMDSVSIGRGGIICPFSTITSNVTIGASFHANIYSYVAHDCHIGDYVTFAPGVKCNGNVRVEDCAYLGTGAILKQGRPGQPLVIGRGAVVGMGSVVTKDVKAGDVVMGNPARSLKRRR
jgi:sugar O-acyltransferase (sialic acid O-acetyltransferase NeuD family)